MKDAFKKALQEQSLHALRNAGLQADNVCIHSACPIVNMTNGSAIPMPDPTKEHISIESNTLRATAADENTAIVQGRIRILVTRASEDRKPSLFDGRIAHIFPVTGASEGRQSLLASEATCDASIHLNKENGGTGNGWTVLSVHLMKTQAYETSRVSLSDGSRTLFVEPRRILFIESSGKRQIAHCKNGTTHEIRLPLYELEEKLPRFFVRIHRCFIVNKMHVREISRQGVELDSGHILPVAARRFSDIKRVISRDEPLNSR